MKTPAIEVLPDVDCDAMHCMDEHPNLESPEERDDALRTALREIVEAYHAGHDVRFPWSLCSRDVCRDVAIALGLR